MLELGRIVNRAFSPLDKRQIDKQTQVDLFMLVIKLSGKALSDEHALQALFSQLHLSSQEAIIVHGGGVEVDKLLSALNFKSEKKDGIRISPKEQMPYITAMLAGACNKTLQGLAIKSSLNAVGLLCTDFNLCALEPYPFEYGQVAAVKAKDSSLVAELVHHGITPVICSIGLDAQGSLFNINADEVAACLALELKAPLVFFSDVKGVLDSHGQLIEHIDETLCEQLLADGTINEGMAVKVKNALKVAKHSGAPVFIASIFDAQARANLSSLRCIGTTLSA